MTNRLMDDVCFSMRQSHSVETSAMQVLLLYHLRHWLSCDLNLWKGVLYAGTIVVSFEALVEL